MSVKVVPLPPKKAPQDGHNGNNGGEPPMSPTDYITRTEFDAAMKHIEVRLEQTASKTDLASLRADMHEGFSSMIKWVVGAALGLGVAGITVMTFVLNNATSKAPQTPPPPVIINLPAAQAPATTAK